METETRTRITEEALRLFSERGYRATSVQDIAKAVGIKAPSLYNHFESKQSLFDAIVSMMTARFGDLSEAADIPGGALPARVERYADGGIDVLRSTAHRLFHYYLSEASASRFRKLLSIERHGGPEADRIYTKIYIDDPIAFQTEIFAALIRRGDLIDEDPEIMALHFFSPIALLLDRYADAPEREREAFKLLDRHIEQFCRIYAPRT